MNHDDIIPCGLACSLCCRPMTNQEPLVPEDANITYQKLSMVTFECQRVQIIRWHLIDHGYNIRILSAETLKACRMRAS